MATAANPSLGATPASGEDPFVGHSHNAVRYAAFDQEQISLLSSGSPSQARRALEAHLRDTDRRIQDASRLGTTLLQQRKDLSARLDEVKQVQQDNDVPADLRKKLAELEKEFNEVGRESARAFLPKARIAGTGENMSTPATFAGSGRESPTKATAPSRRQRNQPSNRVYDIEFATEISTSLLAQVRQLQFALAEKEDMVKEMTLNEADMKADLAGMAQRIKQMDENEQRYKDHTWNLETRLQDLEVVSKSSSDKEQRLAQTLKATQAEKAATQRDLDDLRVSHDRLNEEHAATRRQYDGDIFALRRDAMTHEADRTRLQKRVDELTRQNTELAKAVSSRWNQPSTATDTEFVSADEDRHASDGAPEDSLQVSPVKGTPRHGMLESETLRSSLTHAHRMIQNLKNNIHREKTEKIELKRMLQDARDELEARRNETAVGANVSRKRKTDNDSRFRKPARPGTLGAPRSGTTEIFDDEPDWEDADAPQTPSKSRGFTSAAAGASAGLMAGTAFMSALDSSNGDSTDHFETATERDGTTTDAFETGRESFEDEDSDELTETEDGGNRADVLRAGIFSLSTKAGDRRSYLSTASTSAGEEDDDDEAARVTGAPSQPRYRVRMNHGSRRPRVDDLAFENSAQYSPASSMGTPQPVGQSLGDELDALDESSVGGTPGRYSASTTETPLTQRLRSVEPDSPEAPSILSNIQPETPVTASAAEFARGLAITRPAYADAGMMTEPWEPQQNTDKTDAPSGLLEKTEDVVGGAVAGFGLGQLSSVKGESNGEIGTLVPQTQPTIETEPASTPLITGNSEHSPEVEQKETAVAQASLAHSEIVSQETIPIPRAEMTEDQPREVEPSPVAASTAPADATYQALALSQITSQDFQPEKGISQAEANPEEILGFSSITTQDSQPFEPEKGISYAEATPAENLSFSSITTQDSQPSEPTPIMMVSSPPAVPQRAADRMSLTSVPVIEDGPYHAIPGTEGARPGAGLFGTASAYRNSEVQTTPRRAFGAVDGDTATPIVKPLRLRNAVLDEGSQTVISGEEIENILQSNTGLVTAAATGLGVGYVAARPQTADGSNADRLVDAVASTDSSVMRSPKRPNSAGNSRTKSVVIAEPPPLPEGHTRKIAAAQHVPVTSAEARVPGDMGPPTMPASAYKQLRPTTPHGRAGARSAQGTRPHLSPGGVSRRSSMSSFASEIDERFNLRHGNVMYPEDVKPTTDPRMMQAITQTMIGEYLWKYTRKAGRSETSSTRHRRFFWVHPYTRTLYWSEKDPSTAGRDMLKAKSVAIEAVRVTTDDNAFPPGLHRKSLVVVTPGRDIVFTAPTGQRHETWFNALSYLLLRTDDNQGQTPGVADQNGVDVESSPGVGGSGSVRRSISRITGRSQSRVSLSSYNSRTTANSAHSPTRAAYDASTFVPTLTQRQPAAAAAAAARGTSATRSSAAAPSMSASALDGGGATQRNSSQRDSVGGRGRLSSITNKFRSSSNYRGSQQTGRGRSSFSSRHGANPGDPSDIYDASVVDDSAEDLRAVMARQEQQSDRVENVRACCDGKHDVGSLSHRGPIGNSLASRLSTHGSHTHQSRR